MADFCSLCGEKLPFFGAKSLVCANQDEMFCSKCHDVIYPMENLERGRYLLEHGKPDNPEEMQKFITLWEERARQKKTFEPPTRPCPNCAATMELKLKDFRIGAYADSLLGDRYDIDLYACPECGKVELYTANFAAIKARQARQEAEQASRTAQREQEIAAKQQEYTSYSSGRKPGEKPPWEK